MAPKKIPTRFANQTRAVLTGSEKRPAAPSVAEKPAPLAGKLIVSVIVRRKKPLKAIHTSGKQRITRAQFRASHAADPAAVKAVRAFAKDPCLHLTGILLGNLIFNCRRDCDFAGLEKHIA